MANNNQDRLKVVFVEQHKIVKCLTEQIEKLLQLLTSRVSIRCTHCSKTINKITEIH